VFGRRHLNQSLDVEMTISRGITVRVSGVVIPGSFYRRNQATFATGTPRHARKPFAVPGRPSQPVLRLP
jgi:hypothetical protein